MACDDVSGGPMLTTRAALDCDELLLTGPPKALCSLYAVLQNDTGRIVPPKSALTPQRAKDFLASLCINEVLPPDQITVRLCGTRVVRRAGFEVTGGNFLDLVEPKLRQQRMKHYLALLSVPCGALTLLREEYDEYESLVESVALPFSSESGEGRFIVTASSPVDPSVHMLQVGRAKSLGNIVKIQPMDIGAGTDDYMRRMADEFDPELVVDVPWRAFRGARE